MIVGIDAGGTSTRAVVLDSSGRCWGLGRAGGGNPVALGPAQAARGIRDAVEQAIRHARAAGFADVQPADALGFGAAGTGISGHGVGSSDALRPGGTAVLAMAGASSFAAPGAMAAQVREVSGVATAEVTSDLVAMFAAGTPRDRGYVLVSGTGAAALRIERGEVAAAADGLGWLLGDAGSGFWIGHRAVRAALGALSGYGPDTAMAGLLQTELGVEMGRERTPRGRFLAVESAVETFYQMQPIELAKYASIAFTAAKVTDRTFGGLPGTDTDPGGAALFAEGADPVAVDILRRASERLVGTLTAVRLPDVTGPVVLGGTVARRLPGLTAAVRASFGEGANPQVRIVPDGTAGAAVLALRHAGVTVDDAVFERVTTSLADLRRAAG